jgi:hypothetical protein
VLVNRSGLHAEHDPGAIRSGQVLELRCAHVAHLKIQLEQEIGLTPEPTIHVYFNRRSPTA